MKSTAFDIEGELVSTVEFKPSEIGELVSAMLGAGHVDLIEVFLIDGSRLVVTS